MAQEWMFEHAGQTHGPITGAELKRLAASGQLRPTDLVWKAGTERKAKASTIKGLFSPTSPTPSPLPQRANNTTAQVALQVKSEPIQNPGVSGFWNSLPPLGKLVFGLGSVGLLGVLLCCGGLLVVVVGEKDAPKKAKTPEKGGEDGEQADRTSLITQTAPAEIMLLDKWEKQVKGAFGSPFIFAPSRKSLFVRTKASAESVDEIQAVQPNEKTKVVRIDAETYRILPGAVPFGDCVVAPLDNNQMKALLLPADQQEAIRDAVLAIRSTRKKSIILGYGAGGEYIAVRGNFRSGEETAVEVWSLKTNREVFRESAPKVGDEEFVKLAFSPDNRVVAQALREQVLIWELPTGKLLKTLNMGVGRHLMFSPDGEWLLTQQWRDEARARKTDQLVLWNTRSWEDRRVIKPEGKDFNLGAQCAFSQDGKRLATTSDVSGYIKVVTLWDVETGKLRGGFEALEFDAMSFSPDAKLLATWGGSLPQYVNFWDLDAGHLKHRVHVTNAALTSFSPDGRLVTVEDGSGAKLVYDLTKGKATAFKDEVQVERDRVAKSPDISKQAPPITTAQYDQIKVGMTRFEVMRLLGGKGETVKSDTIKRKEGKFGYSVIYRDTVKYTGAGGGHALFDYEGASTDTPLVRKQESGLK